jgi:hypothetical protein
MATWAGVRKLSRPMERCQEMSQWMPTIAEVTAMTESQMYQGTGRGEDRVGVIGTSEL